MYSYKNITNYRLKKEFSYKRTHSMSLLTVSINIARELKEYGVEIYFDEEHISSLDPKNEVMFTLSAAMAQEESRHISENIRWTLAKKMKEGHAFLTDKIGRASCRERV